MKSKDITLLHHNALDAPWPIEDESVQCCVTSPPYWGLRDYGVAGQLGLEPMVEEYVAKIVEVFREVWRVLKPDGTLWLNMGDCYATRPYGDGHTFDPKYGGRNRKQGYPNRRPQNGLKHKDLAGIPWRIAFALQTDGWYLRQDIIWHKPNPMPECVKDRCTKAHEYLFLLAKRKRYRYNTMAMREPSSCPEASTPEDLERAFSGRRATTPEIKRFDARDWMTGMGGNRQLLDFDDRKDRNSQRVVAVHGDAEAAISELRKTFPNADVFSVKFVAETDNLKRDRAALEKLKLENGKKQK